MTWNSGIKDLAKRQSVSLTQIKDLQITGFSTRTVGAEKPKAVIGLQDVQRGVINFPMLADKSVHYVRVEGSKTSDIILKSGMKTPTMMEYFVAPSLKKQVSIE